MKELKVKPLKLKKVGIYDIKPYWRNPRDNKLAIEKVKESISKYGYNNPICVDKKNIIITGHTRHQAMVELGVLETEVAVLDISTKQAKEFRLVDNKTSEFARWKNDELIIELREINNLDMMDNFFDERMINDIEKSAGISLRDVDMDQIEKAEKKVFSFADFKDSYEDSIRTIVCPHCAEEIEVTGK